MYMTRGLAVNCWQIFRRSPKRAVVRVVKGVPFIMNLESKSSRKELAECY